MSVGGATGSLGTISAWKFLYQPESWVKSCTVGTVPTPPGYSVDGCTWRPSIRQNISLVHRLTCNASR